MDAAVEPFKARRIYLLLRDRISSGVLAAGERLPGEPDLAATHGVSRVTIRRALDQLVAEKMLERRPGVGTFVCATAPLGSTVLNFSDVFSHLKEMGRCTEVRLLSFGYAVPAAPVAAALGLAPGEKAQRAVRVRMIGDAPFSYLTTHVPERVGQTYSEADLARQPLLALLERSGVVIGRARQSISATLAGPDVAGLLQLEMGAPLLSLTRVVEDEAGGAVEHLHALYRPDRFTFEMQLQRTGAQGERRWSPLPPPAAAEAATTGENAKPVRPLRDKRNSP
ncbi:UTRA domain-containing protein [Pseudoroseomonas wenyumeiae]|uniref:GntR family transcriptional regulator n=1 Tax=Teichococcus wenyumeiae TaxID=2478470 RepID=A0A3A9JDH6_9PROT|nr:GntR family transcriptional regulator [Pseudoroseomonas wenyumeiae]RKK05397.1 GntR family transcriptional regulator [Pseudoroseomonas wenyumeiae]RMI19126.1 UTRA domain-containing protein [Pseudoroseomonas wenyumeiae]